MLAGILYHYYKTKIKWIKFRRMFSVPRGQKVLDIGGGDGPFPRADVICEKFVSDNSERTNPIFAEQPLVVGDIENLPFADKSFDFVYCSHILEHVQNPESAVNEIVRIGKRGYIEVPSEYLETTATSTPAHLWTIRKAEDGTLIFRKKVSGQIQPHVDDIFRNFLWGKDKSYMAFHWKNFYTLFNIGILWEKAIPIRVEKPSSETKEGGFNKGTVDSLDQIEKSLSGISASRQALFDPRRLLKKLIQKFFTDSRSRLWLNNHLACPICKSPLKKEEINNLACPKCQGLYPVIRSVPLLLKEYFQKKPLK